MNHQKRNNNQFSFQTLNSCLQFPMSSDEVTSFFPDISVITDDKNRSEYSGPSPRNANASCISAITFDDSETVISTNRLRPKSFSSECSKQFRSKDEPLSKRILGVYSIVKNDESSNSFHRMMSMVDALDSKKLSEDGSCHKSSLVKDSSLYSRILSGLQEMDVDEPKDNSRGNFEMEEQEDREVVEEHTDSKNDAIDTASSSNADGNNDNDEDSIAEEIEEQVEEFEDTLSAECSATSNTDMQKIISSCCCSPSFLKKQQDHVSESTRRKNMKEQQQQQELRELAEQQEESQADQWREVFDDRTGRIYYYNRRTRESRWDLPTNSIVVGRRLQVSSSSNRSQQTSAEYSLRDVSMSEMTSNEYGSTIETMDANQDFCSFQTMTSVQHNDTAQSSSQPILNQCDIIHHQQHKSLSSPSGVISSTWDHGIVTQTSHNDGYEHDQIPQDNSTAKKKKQHDFDHHGGIRYVRSHFFCMYCGTEVATANAMKQHLHLNCHEYSRMSQEDPEEHALLQSILKGVWSTYGHRAHQFVEESDKENQNPHFDQQYNKNTKQYHCHHRQRNTNHLEVPGSSSHKLEISQNTNSSMISTTNSSVNDRSTGQHTRHDESIFTLSDEEDTLLDLDFFQHCKKWTTTRSKNRGNNNNSTPPTSPSICSSCAFCGKLFRSGDKLSRHLLLCKERQRSSKKRAISSKNKEVGAKVTAATTTTTRVTPQGKTSSFAMTNSIQSHLLTCSGRRLPGYPPITK
jgi:hypothetical protein